MGLFGQYNYEYGFCGVSLGCINCQGYASVLKSCPMMHLDCLGGYCLMLVERSRIRHKIFLSKLVIAQTVLIVFALTIVFL